LASATSASADHLPQREPFDHRGIAQILTRRRRLDRRGAARVVSRVARPAGITKPVAPHTLRHAFITAALDAGVPLRDMQEVASHADPRAAMRYDRARPQSADIRAVPTA